MKQNLLKSLLVCLFVFAGIGKNFAHDIEVENADGVTIYYDFINDGTELKVTYQRSAYSSSYSGNVVIPESVTYKDNTYSVTAIGDNAFYCCYSLTSVDIPNSVTSIGPSAFRSCSSLETIVVEEGNPYYDSREDCNAIIQTRSNKLITGCKNTKIPNSVTAIGDNAFYGCSGLTSLTIPSSVTSIGSDAFSNCVKLTTLYSLNTTPPTAQTSSFDNNHYKNVNIYVPQEALVAYLKADVWKDFEKLHTNTLTISIDANGLATYCPTESVDFSNATEIAAYKALVSNNTVTLTRVETVAAGEGVLLRSLDGGAAEEELPVAADATKNVDNAFVGTVTDITLATTEGNVTNFVLSKVDGAIGFFKANNTLLAAGKAYLPVENYNASRSLSIVFDDGTTGISEIASEQPTDDVIYTLGGVRVTKPAKGLYIKNGKKVFIK